MTPMLLDIGTGELLVLLLLAALLLGPDKVPPLAKKAARVLRFLRGVANNATTQIKAELGSEVADLGLDDLHPKNLIGQVLTDDTQSELSSLRAEMTTMRAELKRLNLAAAAPTTTPPSIAALISGDWRKEPPALAPDAGSDLVAAVPVAPADGAETAPDLTATACS